MNPLKKRIAVRFFQIEADDIVIKKFIGAFKTLIKLGSGTDIVLSPSGRYIIKCVDLNSELGCNDNMLFWSTIKERNTWQVRSNQSGMISSLEDSNSIVGDISYYKFNPENNILAAFTTYSPAAYLKSMCNLVLKRLIPNSSEYTIGYLSDDKSLSQVKEWDYYSKISIKLNTEKIQEEEEVPELIKALLDIKATFGGSEISVTLGGKGEKLPKQDVTETVNYLASSEGCSSLSLQGGMFEQEEEILPVNLKRAFIKYNASIELKVNQKYIGIEQGYNILTDAFQNTSIPELKK